jgi:hypothetical protein
MPPTYILKSLPEYTLEELTQIKDITKARAILHTYYIKNESLRVQNKSLTSELRQTRQQLEVVRQQIHHQQTQTPTDKQLIEQEQDEAGGSVSSSNNSAVTSATNDHVTATSAKATRVHDSIIGKFVQTVKYSNKRYVDILKLVASDLKEYYTNMHMPQMIHGICKEITQICNTQLQGRIHESTVRRALGIEYKDYSSKNKKWRY